MYRFCPHHSFSAFSAAVSFHYVHNVRGTIITGIIPAQAMPGASVSCIYSDSNKKNTRWNVFISHFGRAGATPLAVVNGHK